MKQLKLILALLLIAAAACNKNNSAPEVKKEELTFAEVSKFIPEETALKIFDGYGLTEEDPVARGKKRVKENATVNAWFNDITLSGSPASFTYTTSQYAQWGGVTSFPESLSTEGSYGVFSCNRLFDGAWQPSVTCSDSPRTGTRVYQAFTADYTRTDSTGIHVSNFVTVTN